MATVKIKHTRGKTWAKLKSDDFITPEFLEKVGELLLESIVFEAGKDFAKQGNRPTPRGEPEGIPRSVRFFDSFSYKVVNNTVEIHSDWPWIDQIIEGRPAYDMDWLRRDSAARGDPINPAKLNVEGRSRVIFRTTPGMGKDGGVQRSWVHPGFRKHNFLRRGYEKARKKVDKMLEKQVEKVLNETPIA